MRLNNTEKYLFGATSAIFGLGLQKLLPIQYQLPLTREALLFFGFSIPLVYYFIYIEILCFKKLKELIEEKLEQSKG